ncbi:MAG: replicative DNA helicase [Kiritimatiellia bacterium]|jgi:replicative DNA helicase
MPLSQNTFPEERPALRVPPYSAEAEQAVLGAILLDAPRAMEVCAEASIVADSFWISANRTIFETAWRLYGAGNPVDIVTVAEELRGRGELDIAGGIAALERMVEGTPAVAHADYYASILREKHLLRRVISVTDEAQAKCYAPDRSVQLIISETEQAVLAISDTQKDAILPWKDSVQHTMGKIEAILQRKDGINGLPTGFRNLDDRLRGLRNAEMIVLAARPSMGKTSLAMNICENIALGTNVGGKVRVREPLPVGIFSCEMSADALISRMICSRARVSLQRVMSGLVNKADATLQLTRAASDLMNAPIYVDDTGGLDVMDLRARARRMKKKYDIRLIMIDYLQLLNSRDYANQGRQLETVNISANIKAMAKELDVPVLILSQLSRAPENRDKEGTPRISDLRDSGAIEQDADIVMLLWRPSYYVNKLKDASNQIPVDDMVAKVDIGKNRNGATGVAELTFESEFTQFSDATNASEYE